MSSEDAAQPRPDPKTTGKRDRNSVSSAASHHPRSIKRVSPARFLVLSLVFHLVYIWSIFDIYFTSPVVHPELRYSVRNTAEASQHTDALEPAAKRLVLIVGDGLRADTLFKKHSSELLPPWATVDSNRFSLEGTGKRWDTFAADPVRSAYPFSAALQANKTKAGDSSSQHVPKDAFAGPFLRAVALNRGIWGISHTRVPTESRPGHVAMIAGMYEDVSAVTKGWKLNPIAFDSLLNQSSHSFAFGSPDIIPMFAVGAASDRVNMWTYDEGDEDFTKDATHLDLWVLDRLKQLFGFAKADPFLRKKLEQPGTVFFLHLLGLDTTGHFFRPASPEYVGNTIVVDAIAQEVERMMDDFFGNDGRTAYVFSADHGMSDKGNHGDGDPDNTRTPILAWGAGVRKPQPASKEEKQKRKKQESQDSYYSGWDLDNVARVDIDQADITPLMSTLLGIPFPANSQGRLRQELLDLPEEHKARALLANAQQVLETYRFKHQDRASRMVRFVPFAPLTPAANERQPGDHRVEQIKDLIEAGEHAAAISLSNELISLAIEGADYIQTYDWLLLCSIVTIGYIGSILNSLAFLLRTYMLPDNVLSEAAPTHVMSGLNKLKLLIAPASGGVFAIFAAQKMPLTYYMYAALAFFFCGRVIGEHRLFQVAYRYFSKESGYKPGWASIIFNGTVVLGMLELMALGYLHRAAWLLGFLAVGFGWPAVSLSAHFKSANEGLLLSWGMTCFITGLFTISNVTKEESIWLLTLSAAVFFGVGWGILSRPDLIFPSSVTSLKKGNEKKSQAEKERAAAEEDHLRHTLTTLKVQLVVLVVTAITTAISARSLKLKKGLPLTTQIIAWFCLAFSFIFPFIYGFRSPTKVPSARSDDDVSESSRLIRQPPSQRLTIVVFAFAPIFVLLSLRDEVLFFGCYTLTLLVWAKVEGSIHEQYIEHFDNDNETGKDLASQRRLLEPRDLRISLFFLFFLHVGFFGTGNIASISSFYLSPVYRLVPIFSPFLMAALLLVKILVPFLILNAVFQTLCGSSPNFIALRNSRKSLHSSSASASSGKSSSDDKPSEKVASSATYDLAHDRGLKLLGATSPGGLGLKSSLSLVFGACIAADVLALNFLFAVKSEGSWLEIGQTITHFVMANMLQVFMLGLAAASSAILGSSSH